MVFKYHLSNCLRNITAWCLIRFSNQPEQNWTRDFLPISLSPSYKKKSVPYSVFPLSQYMKTPFLQLLKTKFNLFLLHLLSNTLVKPLSSTFKTIHNLSTSHYLVQRLLPYWPKPLTWTTIKTFYLLPLISFLLYGLFFPQLPVIKTWHIFLYA